MTNNSKIRVRQSGFISPVTRRPIFRIEDQQGQVLRRISSARNPDEAVAHYWRSAGSDAKFGVAMPDQPSDASLRRRIAAARTGRVPGTAGRVAMRTHELALPELELPTQPDVNETLPEDIETSAPVRAAPTPKRRVLKPKPQPQAEDLFEPLQPKAAPEAIEPVEAEPTVAEAAQPKADLPEAEAIEPELAPASAVEEPGPEPIHEPEPEPEPEPDMSAPYHLDPQTVLLQQVDHRNLRPNDRTDSYLYHVTNRAEAKVALDNGLVVSAQDPVILTERPGVAYWLSVLAEDFDFILDGPADFVVLRMRRFAVETLLEPDPHASRSAGCACYLLTGGPAQDRQG
ncbi:hypothetical protein HN018_21280 [Lichenicola cladoniae]|uniref:Uncharacterized protein n=1 Tax=Lichenicola cladoniae TaxID=1484109 RepID=A0A6M8HUK8_9PROT|nr:hypothetical protein [Lichenicola cladoniae]NPD69387.1 hypothetical protein [Acetobacteraceae bacterium]QKE92229.1 hypothetical protein HN018_21280 [Lichenicola cladoniae]